MSYRIDGLIDHHTQIEQSSKGHVTPIIPIFTDWNPDLFVSTCTYLCADVYLFSADSRLRKRMKLWTTKIKENMN